MKNISTPYLSYFLIFCWSILWNIPGLAENAYAPLPLDVTIGLKKDVSCHGEEDGAITFVIAGLSSVVKYSYKLKDGEGHVLKEGSEGLVDNLIDDLLNLNTGLTVRFEDLAAGDYTFVRMDFETLTPSSSERREC